MKTKKTLSPLKAIRAKCLDCCCDQSKEVQLCPCDDCPLYPFRSGRDPARANRLTEEQRVKAAERLAEVRKRRGKQPI